MPINQNLLTGAQSVAWTAATPPNGAIPELVYMGRDDAGLGPIQVALATVSTPPSKETMRALHALRKGKSNIQLVIGAILGDRIWIFGPDERTQVIESLPLDQGCRQLQSALDEPNALAAYTRLGQFRRSLDTTSLVGVTNSGLFASYHIRENVPKRTDWHDACAKSKPWLSLRTDQLIKALGFKSEKTAGNALLLTSGTPQSKAVAILLDESEQFDSTSARHTGISPVAFGLNIAARQGVPWLFVLRKDQIRIYPAKDGVGVGQKGQVETYLEIDLAAIDSERAGLLALIFSADALEPNGTAHELLEGSQRFASQLGLRLRERIYEHVVPQLSKSVAEHLRDQGTKLDSEGLSLAYRLTLRILFRLLFQAYAEDRGLLPAGRNEGYDANSLKTIAKRIITIPPDKFGPAKTLWFDLAQVWDAIDEGNETWNVPAYNGGLFSTDEILHPEGARIQTLNISDQVLGPVLQHLLIDISEENILAPVDFRSLSVREFGTIYEGLLESSLSIATDNLTADSKGVWIPSIGENNVLVREGELYFHSSSGERKSSGSFFTPTVVVDHLINQSVDRSLDEHLSRIRSYLDQGDTSRAALNFFDFRVADLAMGSGHFLIAAVDRIESKMRTFLTEKSNDIPGINAELKRLENAARLALGNDEVAFGQIEPATLLRRQIARRCIYGLDVNPLAVELARLALWIHTFVPGLPMSSLDHGLVCANSLTGIGTIDEALLLLDPEMPDTPLKDHHARPVSMFEDEILQPLLDARELLLEAAKNDEASKAEVKAASTFAHNAKLNSKASQEIFDTCIAIRLGILDARAFVSSDQIKDASTKPEVRDLIQKLNPAHMPFLFPEVFVRDNPGFDVILGNPPWEEVTVEDLKFWNRHFPGLKTKSNAEQKNFVEEVVKTRLDLVEALKHEKANAQVIRHSLVKGPYPGMGAGDPDLYKGFAWRNWQFIRSGGVFAAVFPRALWVTKGSAPWRIAVISNATVSIELCRNEKEWMFEGVNPGLQVSLVVVQKIPSKFLEINGEFRSAAELEKSESVGKAKIAIELLSHSDPEMCIPSVESGDSLELWSLILNFPTLSDGRVAPFRSDFRAAPATELHVTNDGGGEEGLFLDDDSAWPVYNHLNIGRYRFEHLNGVFAHVDFELAQAKLFNKWKSTHLRSDSPFSIMNTSSKIEKESLPLLNPRIVFRDVVHASNDRKIWFALAPAKTVLTNKAPYLVFNTGDLFVQSYVLGLMNSSIVDWYGHLKINLNLNFFILYTIPIPEYRRDDKRISRLCELSAGLAIQESGDFGGWSKIGKIIEGDSARSDSMAEIDALAWSLFNLPRKFMKIVFNGNPLRSDLETVTKYLDRMEVEK